MAKGVLCFEKVRRCLRTLFFMVAMLASLLVTSLPVLVAVGDVLVPSVLISSFTCVRCYEFKEHLQRYAFKSSLTDIPLVSVVRSFIIICVYSMCDGPVLSHGPYLGTVTLCSFFSVLLLSIKACIFSVNSQIEAEASFSLSRKKLHLKKSWGMPILFFSSVAFSLGHTVVAYRTSCKARRKLFYHQVDPEAVLSCKSIFSGYQKASRSPTRCGGKTPISDSELRKKPLGIVPGEKTIPVRLLADKDSLFINCQGISVHYKLALPGSPPPILSSRTYLGDNSTYSTPALARGKANFDRHAFHMSRKSQHQLCRSYSSHFTSSLYAPLLEDSASPPIPTEEIPYLNLHEVDEVDEITKLNTTLSERDLKGDDQLGIVLVHGFGGGVFSWRHVMGPLARQIGCRVAAFDRPGWGITSRPRKEDWEEKDLPNAYKLETQVDLLLSFCAEMGFSSVVLFGHDDGGLLVLKAAQRVQTSRNYNIMIRGVVLLNANLSREVVPSFARILLHTSLGKKHLVRPLLRTEITQVVNRHAWYDATKLTAETMSLYKAPLVVEGWDEALHEIGKLSYETVLSAANAELLLKAVHDTPVLVIAGAEDALVSLKSSQAMASKFVNSRLVALSGCGHLPHEECPKALLAATTPFITRLLLSSPSDLQSR